MYLILWRGHRLRQNPKGICNITGEPGTFLGLTADIWDWEAGAVECVFALCTWAWTARCRLCHSTGSTGSSRFHVCWGGQWTCFSGSVNPLWPLWEASPRVGASAALEVRRCCDAFWSGLLEGLGLRTPPHVCDSGLLGPLLGRPAAVTGVSLVTSTLVFVNSRRTGI